MGENENIRGANRLVARLDMIHGYAQKNNYLAERAIKLEKYLNVTSCCPCTQVFGIAKSTSGRKYFRKRKSCDLKYIVAIITSVYHLKHSKSKS
jgi:hypothetical protein